MQTLSELKLSHELAVERFAHRIIGGPETIQDVENDLKSPDSLRKRTVMTALVEIFLACQRDSFIQSLIARMHNIEATLEELRREVSQDKVNVDNEEDKEHHRQILDTLKSLEYRLDTSVFHSLSILLKERDDLISTVVKEWRDQRSQQVAQLSSTIRDLIPLTGEEITLLSHVPKAQEIMLTHPELIPGQGKDETSFKAAVQKSDTNLLITLGRIQESKNLEKAGGKYTLHFGTPPATNDPQQNLPSDTVYVHAKDNVVYYTVKDPMGEIHNTKIQSHEMHDAYFRNLVKVLETPSLSLGDETKRAVFELISRAGYSPKAPYDDIQRLSPGTIAQLKKLNPLLVPLFAKHHTEDDRLMEKQESLYEKLQENAEKIRASAAANAAIQLEKEASVARGKFALGIQAEMGKYISPTPFSIRLQPTTTANAV